jgi:hypothetical protein
MYDICSPSSTQAKDDEPDQLPQNKDGPCTSNLYNNSISISLFELKLCGSIVGGRLASCDLSAAMMYPDRTCVQ